MFKKFMVLMMVLSICASMNISVYAAEPIDGDLTIEEGANATLNTIENQRLLEQKRAQLEEIKEQLSMGLYSPRALDYNTLSITCFQQETNYWCGPATVKQVVHFLNGSSNSQAYYAEKLKTTEAGTDMTLIPGVIKAETGVEYAYDSIGTESSWFDKIFVSVMNSQPAILDINTMNVSAFPYSVGGHLVNVSGYDATGTKQVRITDPFVKGLGNRWYNATDLYTANSNHFRQAVVLQIK